MKNTLVLLLVGNKAPTPELVQEMIQDQELRYLIIKDQNRSIADQIIHWLDVVQTPNNTLIIRILPYHPDHKGWNQTSLTDLKRRLFPESMPSSMVT